MDDQELDRLLTASRPSITELQAAKAGELVGQTEAMVRRASPARQQHRLRTIGVAVACLGVATAGATLTAAQLNLPPFQTSEPGIQRIPDAIPADYVDVEGNPWTCDSFMEFRDLDRSESAKVATYVKDHDWRGFGNDAYQDAQRISGQSPDQITSTFYAIVGTRLEEHAQHALQGISVRSYIPDEPTYSGSSISCSPGRR